MKTLKKLKLVESSEEIKLSYLEKSDNSLRSAKILHKNNLFENSVSMSYYVMYNSLTSLLFKIGIIAIFFGIGLGLGMISGSDEGTREIYMPASIFIFTGIGFVIANLVGNKMREKYKAENN